MYFSSYGGKYETFKQITCKRLVHEMLRSTKTGATKSTWKVLILDKFTLKIISYAFKMTDIIHEGVSLVEDIYRKRQPLSSMDAIYFIQPTKENIHILLSDMSGKKPFYRKAYVFFTSPIAGELDRNIKKDGAMLPRIICKELDLEYFAIDSQSFITGNEGALQDLFGVEESNCQSDSCLDVMARRIATVFASLREFPLVRYRAAKSIDANMLTTSIDLIPTKLAARVWNSLTKYKQTRPNFPQAETCELLIIDRSIDQVSPFIHEWYYDAICHDLLNMEGNKYVQEVPCKTGGQPQRKVVLLEEHDSIWLELRHAHIADVYEKLHEKMTNFIAKHKATQICGSGYGSELSTRDLQKMVQALPQYAEEIDKLSLHIEIAGRIDRIIRDLKLKELGQLEVDLAFGVAGMKDVIKFLNTNKNASHENKLRLLMITAAIYPEEFDGEKGLNLMKLADLPTEDMNAVINMRLLREPSDTKKAFTGIFPLTLDFHKRRHAGRKERVDVDQAWQLSRFYPMIEELIEKLAKGELSEKEYPCINEPNVASCGSSPTTLVHQAPTDPMRSRRTPTWARTRNFNNCNSVPKHASRDFQNMGRRIFVFVIGGATRSELRVCHMLTNKLKREIVLGSSSLDDPSQFVLKLKQLRVHGLYPNDVKI